VGPYDFSPATSSVKKGHSGDQRYLRKQEGCFVCFVCVHDLATRRMGTATGDGKIVRRESGVFETATLFGQMVNPR
jgi:hypothetical protein